MSIEQVRSARTEGEPLPSVENLRTSFYTDKEVIHVVDGISSDIFRGETVDIVGESGSGRSVTARPIIRLVEKSDRIENGHIIYDSEDLLGRSAKQMRSIRDGSVTMIFQDPLTSLSPVYTVDNQIKEAFRLHRGPSGSKATKEAIGLLEAVGIPNAYRRVRGYPHQSSGGMCRRAVIAMALACDPEPLIYDEPTVALDVTIQAQVLELFEELQEECGLGIMFITHDMGVIAEIVDRVGMMYADEIVESVPVVRLFESSKHPCMRGLLNSIPEQGLDEDECLATIKGDVPTSNEGPVYCRFTPRCLKAFTECDTIHPEPVEVGDGMDRHRASYLLYPDDLPMKGAIAVHREGGQRRGDTRWVRHPLKKSEVSRCAETPSSKSTIPESTTRAAVSSATTP